MRFIHLLILLFVAGPVLAESGKSDRNASTQQALHTDGSLNAVVIPHSSSLNFSNTLSVFVWVKTRDGTFNTGIFAKSNYTQSKRCWGIETWDHGRVLLALLSDNGQVGQSIYGNTVINDGQWHHVGWTFDSGKVELYVDKRKEKKTFLTNNRVVKSLNQEAATAVTIGSLLDGKKPTLPITGTIYRPMAINKPLRQAEVDELYDLDFTGSRDATRLSFWSDVKFSARFSGGGVRDDSGNKNNGASAGAALDFVNDLPGRR